MTAGTAVLYGIGRAVAWVMQHSRARVRGLEKRLDELEGNYRKLWLAFGFVATGLHAKDPHNPNLKQAARILGDAFPLDMDTPADMEATLREIDRKDVK